MVTQRALSGVAHDIAHHTQSGLSWINPHFAQACRTAGVRGASFELLVDQPYPESLPKMKPLALALGALRDKFWEILERNQFRRDAVSSVRLTVSLPSAWSDDFTTWVSAKVTAANGREYHAKLT